MPPKRKLKFAEIVKAMQKLEAAQLEERAKEEEEQKREQEIWQQECDKEDMVLYIFLGIFLLLIGLLYVFGGTLDLGKKP